MLIMENSPDQRPGESHETAGGSIVKRARGGFAACTRKFMHFNVELEEL